MQVGEATPYYLFHPAVPVRARALMPQAKVIMLLRNPIDRAISQHNHETALGFETLPLGEALDREAERLAGEERRLLADPWATSYPHQHFSYAGRSRYAEQLERWLAVYPREQIRVLISEEFYEDPIRHVMGVQRFLGLPPVPPADVTPRNVREYSAPAQEAVRARLASVFAEENERLARLLGRELPWD
jgi:hypothetical protein